MLLGWKLRSLICSLSWDVVASYVCVHGLFKMQNKSDVPELPSEVSQPPWLLWDPLQGQQPNRLSPCQCPEKKVQMRRCTSGYQPKSRGKISSEKYFGFHSGNFIEGVSTLYSEASLGENWSLSCLRVGALNCLSLVAFAKAISEH